MDSKIEQRQAIQSRKLLAQRIKERDLSNVAVQTRGKGQIGLMGILLTMSFAVVLARTAPTPPRARPVVPEPGPSKRLAEIRAIISEIKDAKGRLMFGHPVELGDDLILKTIEGGDSSKHVATVKQSWKNLGGNDVLLIGRIRSDRKPTSNHTQ